MWSGMDKDVVSCAPSPRGRPTAGGARLNHETLLPACATLSLQPSTLARVAGDRKAISMHDTEVAQSHIGRNNSYWA